MSSSSSSSAPAPAGAASAIFAGGCFWCVEAPYAALRGVHSATSGYIGGRVANPSYADVCAGETGHAEAVRVLYDPAAVSFEALLDVFFTLHDPTQLNRQGNDHGTQYRSAIFYADEAQRAAALEKMRALRAKLPNDVVTQLEPASAHTWYPAEEYHQVRERCDAMRCDAKRAPKRARRARASESLWQ
jgi:peptide-methionine (S)-S-oxide reductase